MIDHPAGSTDHDLRSFLYLFNLPLDRLSAINRRDINPAHVFRKFDKFTGYLNGQFTGRAHDNSLHLFCPKVDTLQYRNSKRGGFSGSGLGMTGNIPSFQDHRDGGGLNFCGCFEAHFLYSFENGRTDSKISKLIGIHDSSVRL